jgi:hypothetical protein
MALAARLKDGNRNKLKEGNKRKLLWRIDTHREETLGDATHLWAATAAIEHHPVFARKHNTHSMANT